MRAQKPATIYLLRHGHSTANAKSVLAGRDFKVSLSATGRKQALAIQAELSEKTFAKIYSSPLPRCIETLTPLAILLGQEIEILEEVIELANHTNYGLGSYFYTNDNSRIWRVSQALQYGMVGINECSFATEVAPFGGIKHSGFGREGSHLGIEEFCQVKTLHLSF